MVDGIRDWGPRVLAPVAFFVAATILILLVQNALSGGNEPTARNPAPNQTAAPGPTTNEEEVLDGSTTEGEPRKRYCRVRSGDLLQTIAEEFDTTVERLIEFNPGIDPQALTVGQRIRIR